MRIFPALDLFHSKCVRLLRGEYDQSSVYSDNPMEMVAQFYEQGARQLHCVDLEGARQGKFLENKILKAILERFDQLKVQVGGGMRSFPQVKKLLDMGVERVVIGTMAASEPDMVASWIKELGPSKFCIGLDLRNGKVATEGWREELPIDVDLLVRFYRELGVTAFLCTDVARDGTLTGPNFELYQNLFSKQPELEWIASGGVQGLEDLRKLQAMGIRSAIVGKALYEGRIQLKEALELEC